MEASKQIGKEVGLKIELKSGKLNFTVSYDGSGADASVSVALEPGYFMDKLAQAIPGEVDDAVISALKLALQAA